jgi:hypothetical protein
MISMRADGTYFGEMVDALKPDCTGLTGLAGGCAMPSSWESLVHPDLGLVTNTRPRLSGDTRPQTPITILTTGGIISTTSGSSVIRFTTPSAHGFSNGNQIGVQLLDPSVTNVGGIDIGTISYLRFAAANVTSTTFDVDLSLYYVAPGAVQFQATPLMDATSFIATSTVSGAGGALRLYKVSNWRDAWLEASIKWAVTHPVSARNSRTASREQLTPAAPAPRRSRTVREMYRRDSLACPTGVTLTPLDSIVPTVNLTVYATSKLPEQVIRAQLEVKGKEAGRIIQEQLANGGLCLDAADGNRIKATPSLTAYGKLVYLSDGVTPFGPAKK